MEQKQKELRLLVEKTLGMIVKTPSDFEQLIGQIDEKTGQRLSMSTVKRFWGYVDKDRENYKVRTSTLDILAQYAGYQNWATFCQVDLGGDDDESNDLANRYLYTKELAVGTLVQLRWKPDRLVTVRFEGGDLFTVVESINSKLHPSDTFHCSHIVEGLPLTLFNLVREGKVVGNYVCGKTHGVTFQSHKK